MINILNPMNTVMFLLLFLLWKRSDWINTFIKLSFCVLFIMNLLVSLELSGYIIKV